MNISELARRLRATPDEIREKLPLLGFDVGHKAIKVDDRLVNKIMEKWGEMKKLERLKLKYKRDEEIKEAAYAKTKDVRLPKVISVRDFAATLSLPVTMVIGELMKNGILASLNERIDFETASIVAGDLGFNVAPEAAAHDDKGSAGMSADELKSLIEGESSDDLKPRPPIVVVMGHVDHGKTKILDAIRKTNVLAGESGGITQHIGAYQAVKKDRRITFIDTPGHEAFTVMRSRGARVADVAVLVVAADDGVQPQTEEVIRIIQAAKLPFVVALNKIDKPEADANRVKTQLAEKGVQPEDWGSVPVVPVSAKTGQGLDDLLDVILLVADMEKDRVRANPEALAVGTIIESHVDKGEGPVATVLVQNGTLRSGDVLAVGGTQYGRVRAMKDWNGAVENEAVPGMPVKILGFKIAPQVGDIVQVPSDASALSKLKKQVTTERQVAVTATSQIDEEKKEGRKFLNVIVKADVLGSLEAIVGQLEKMKTAEVGVSIVGKGLGNVNDADVLRAEATGALILAFHVLTNRQAESMAQSKKVEIKTASVIYALFDEVRPRLEKLLPAEIITTKLGKLEVLALFRSDKAGQVIGGRVIDGKLLPDAQFALYRGVDVVGEGKILQLQSGKQEAREIRMGQECGLKVQCRTTIEAGDLLDVFTEERKVRKLELPI